MLHWVWSGYRRWSPTLRTAFAVFAVWSGRARLGPICRMVVRTIPPSLTRESPRFRRRFLMILRLWGSRKVALDRPIR
jgi:hypothetical protein